MLRLGKLELDPAELPWVTLTVAALCLGLSLAMTAPAALPQADADAAFELAVGYWNRHAYLEAEPELLLEVGRGLTSAERRSRIEGLRDESYRRYPSDAEQRALQQGELDALTQAAVAAAEREPSGARLGFVPAAPTLQALAIHPFWHGHLGALAFQLLALLLLGAVLEARLRAPRMAALTLGSWLAGAGFYFAMVPGATLPLSGAATLGAGWLGCALVLLRTGWSLGYPIWSEEGPALARIELPAWVLVAAWGACQVGAALLVGFDAWVYQAPVGALICAAGAVALLQDFERAPRAHRKLAPEDDSRPALERAREAQARGDTPRAFALLQGAVRASPGERETVLAFWDVALACGRTDAACPPMLALVREFVSGDEAPLAARYWLQLTRLMPGVRLDAPTLIALAPTLAKVGQKEAALDAVKKSIAPRARDVSGPVAMRAAELADQLGDPSLAVEAGQLALSQPDLQGPQRVALRQLIGDAAVRAEEAGGKSFPSAEGELPDEPALGEELSSAVEPRFPSVKVIEGVPEFLGDTALQVRLSSKGTFDVEYSRVQAIASAGVLGLGEHPVVIIDLAMNWDESDGEPLRVVRLRGDRFDPRSIIGDGVRIAEAYRVLLRELYGATGALPLPDEKSACGGPMRVFESMESYQRKVLDAGE